MNAAMEHLRELAVFTAQQIHLRKNGWPKASSWHGRCRLGNTMSGIEQSFLRVGRTGLWLGEDGRLYVRATVNGSHHYKWWGQTADRSQRRIDQIAQALHGLR